MNLPNCLDCGITLKRHHNKRCRPCFGKFISKRISGKNHYKETLLRLAPKYEQFWNINNGITLCEPCHIKTFKNKGAII